MLKLRPPTEEEIAAAQVRAFDIRPRVSEALRERRRKAYAQRVRVLGAVRVNGGTLGPDVLSTVRWVCETCGRTHAPGQQGNVVVVLPGAKVRGGLYCKRCLAVAPDEEEPAPRGRMRKC